MTPKEKAKELIKRFDNVSDEQEESVSFDFLKQCALISVQYIITSNPHSNPFNTDVHSTMYYWEQVKAEIEKL